MRFKIPQSRLVRVLLLASAALTILLVLAFIFSPQLLTLKGGQQTTPGDDWSTYMHDNTRTGASTETVISSKNANQLAKLWAFKTGGGVVSQPVIVAGTLYFGSWDGYEYALDAVKGYQKWKTYLGQTTANCTPPVTGITSSATVENNVVYVGGGDNYWYALDAFTGQVLWKVFTGVTTKNTGYYNWASPLIYQGNAYIGIASDCDNPLTPGEVLKVNLSTHAIVGTLSLVPKGEVGGGVWSSPAVDPKTGTIYVTTGSRDALDQTLSQSIVAFNPATMKVASSWQIPLAQSGTDDDWGNSPNIFTASDGRTLVSASDKDGWTYTFNAANLTSGPIWMDNTNLGGTCPACGDGSVSSAAIGDGLMYIAGGKTAINGVGYLGVVRGINPETGQYVWQDGEPNAVVGAVTYVNGLVLDSEGGDFEVLNAKTGARLYNYETGAGIYGAPSVSHGQIYVGSLDGNLYSFNLSAPTASASDSSCPQGWSCQDVGNPKATGSESLNGSGWNISGNGTALAAVSDQFRFINQPIDSVKGVQVAAQLALPQAVSSGAQSALLVRQSLDPGAPFYATILSPSGQLSVQYRTAFNGGLTTIGTMAHFPASSYVEIQRVGDTFQAAISPNGSSYTLLPGSSVSLPVPTRTFVGMASSSGVNGTPGTSVYTHVTIGALSNQPAASTSTSACPSGWSCADVGNPALVGSQTDDTNSVITLKGSGLDIWGTTDQYHFVWQSVSGNATVSAQITDVNTLDPDAKAGVMLRTNATDEAQYYGAFVAPSQGLVVQYRPISGLSTTYFRNVSSIKAPVYLRVARWNNIFTTYTSPDGVNWTAVSGSSVQINIDSPADTQYTNGFTDAHSSPTGPMLAGLAVTAHNANQLNTVSFSSPTVSLTAPVAPTACPTGWICQDIGYPSPPGSQLYDSTTGIWTVIGGGYDVFGTQDQFHYVSEPITGDGVDQAFITSQTNTADSAKAGLMIRASSALDSMYYAVFVMPKYGAMAQFRVANGGGTNEKFPANSYKNNAPICLQIVRSGNSFSGFYSLDDANWILIPGSTVTMNMPTTAMAGLAVTSHNNSYQSIATFQVVTIGQDNPIES